MALQRRSSSHSMCTQPVLLLIALSFFINFITTINGFNFSPQPNIVINAPEKLKIFQPQVRSTYFGYAMVIRPTSIIVGAPRAQSTLELQRKINETGAIYRCSFINGTCSPFVFDHNGNRIIENSEYTFDSERRDNQWLGASMDGGTLDSDKLLVCAPRFIAPSLKDYHMHGICYWINDTLSEKPTNVRKISPLRLKTDQVKEENGVRFYFYIYGEQGLSAHVSANNEEFLIGAPGIHTWKGSVIRYRQKTLTDDPNLSRRDTEARLRKPRQADNEFPEVYWESDVPNPEKWEQPNDSYFGYSVGTGYFDSADRKKLQYVATAPQANQQSGEAYIFDISGRSITKHYVLRGEQFGEYFGYAVLAEDLNGDGLTDIIVSAPQHSTPDSFDNGAIYVFINQGRYNFERTLLVSPIPGKGRFGTTLTKLGDINRDGYNDIAVGAPFAGNGEVFVYLGGAKGLRSVHSQRLSAPKGVQTKYGGGFMYGHGLSKGSDIDLNGFNDFAVGAPNAEAVFLYRAYPVIQVQATVKSQTREIRPDQNKFQITACYGFTTKSTSVRNQDMTIRIVVDPQVKRVKFTTTQTNEMIMNVTAGTTQQCRVLDCDVRYSVADIFKPIELEMHYDIIHGIPDSEVFCETCVAVDPAEPKVYTEKIIFSTGCATDICIADLEVKSKDLSHSYILGSSRSLSVVYEVSNNGETAYLPQINITSSNRMPFARIPSNCKLNNEVALVCDLNRGQPMAKGTRDSITVAYDVSGITGTAMTLIAEVFSTGKEKTPANNVVRDVIALKQFTQVDVVGAPSTPHVNLETSTNKVEMINNYEIKSNGPSTVDEVEIAFYIPVASKIFGTTKVIPIIDMSNITMQAVYDTQLVGIDFYENNTQIIMNTIEFSTATSMSSKFSVTGSQNSIHYDANKMGHINEAGVGQELSSDTVFSASMSRRRRRDAEAQTATKSQYARISQVKSYDLLGDDMKGTLPVNRTIVFNCNDPELTVCVRAVMRVYNFKPEKPLTVTMKFNVDLKEVNEILIEPWEFFVILIGLNLSKVGDLDGTSLAVAKKIEYNIISKHQIYGTPWWVYLLAIIGGLLVLAGTTYGLYKMGFFKRATKEEMDKLVHQNQGAADLEPEAENLNSENNN